MCNYIKLCKFVRIYFMIFIGVSSSNNLRLVFVDSERGEECFTVMYVSFILFFVSVNHVYD